MSVTLRKEAIEAALGTAHARVVAPSKHKWPGGYVNEDYPYLGFWDVFMSSLEHRQELYERQGDDGTDKDRGLGEFA